MLRLAQIQEAGGHFIPCRVGRGLFQFRILYGDILLHGKMYKASFISFPGVKYLLEVGENKKEKIISKKNTDIREKEETSERQNAAFGTIISIDSPMCTLSKFV